MYRRVVEATALADAPAVPVAGQIRLEQLDRNSQQRSLGSISFRLRCPKRIVRELPKEFYPQQRH